MHKRNGSSERIRTLDEDTDAFNFHIRSLSNERFQADGYSLCKLYATRMYGRRRYISPCSGWASTFVCVVRIITYYSTSAPTLIQSSYSIHTALHASGEEHPSSSGWENELPNSYVPRVHFRANLILPILHTSK